MIIIPRETHEVTCNFAGTTYTMTVYDRDYVGNEIARTGRPYEYKELTAIASWGLVGTYLDVGSNIGNHSLAFARMGAKRLICFEMMEQTASVLRGNLARSSGIEHEVNEVLLGAVGQEMTVVDWSGNAGGARAVVGAAVESATRVAGGKMLATSIDDVLRGREIGQVTMVKMDVEGHEYDVIRGARETLVRNGLPVMFVEIDAKNLEPIRRFVAELGYLGDGEFPFARGLPLNYAFWSPSTDPMVVDKIKRLFKCKIYQG